MTLRRFPLRRFAAMTAQPVESSSHQRSRPRRSSEWNQRRGRDRDRSDDEGLGAHDDPSRAKQKVTVHGSARVPEQFQVLKSPSRIDLISPLGLASVRNRLRLLIRPINDYSKIIPLGPIVSAHIVGVNSNRPRCVRASLVTAGARDTEPAEPRSEGAQAAS